MKEGKTKVVSEGFGVEEDTSTEVPTLMAVESTKVGVHVEGKTKGVVVSVAVAVAVAGIVTVEIEGGGKGFRLE